MKIWEKYNDALYREYICNKNVKLMQLSATKTRSYSQEMELISAKEEIQSKADEISAHIDKYYMELFIDAAIGNVIEGDVICAGHAMDCNCVKRIGYLLAIYYDAEDDNDDCSGEGVNFYHILNETLGEYYNTSVLCDDFYHILAAHCNETDFEILYDMMTHIFLRNKACDPNKCGMMKRNNRIRSGNTFNSAQKQQLYGAHIMNDAQQITTKQLLDKLHCFFIHSFDYGHRTFYHHNDAADKFEGIRTRTRGNKFVLNLEQNANDDEDINDIIYSFGHKYLYWNKLQDDDGFVVPMKYNSLKAELLQNDISFIDEASWIELLIISDTFHKANHLKKIYRADFNNRGIKRNDIITQSHLISILMYCNFDLFQRKFTATFRKQTADENMASLIQRHCNFYWMGRLLYESVNIYGKRVVDYEYKTFYHGISQQMYFTSPKSQIYGPLSTTNELSVAQSFGGDDNGLIVVLAPDKYAHNKYFDMAFISDFCSESEFFFIGGLLPMTFKNILNINKGLNYEGYIKNFSILFNVIMNGVKYKFDDDDNNETKLQIIDLIQCKLNNTLHVRKDDNDDYIFKLFDRYCAQRTAISINYPYFESEFKHLFFDKHNIIQLNVFLNLFLNLEYLKMDYVLLSHDLFESILDMLVSAVCGVDIDENVAMYQKKVYLNDKLMRRNKKNHYGVKLNKIQLNYPSIAANEIKIEQYITKYAKMFKKLQWSINYDYIANKMYMQKMHSILE